MHAVFVTSGSRHATTATNMKRRKMFSCSHASSWRLQLAAVAFISSLLLNVVIHYWQKEEISSPSGIPVNSLRCSQADCHCNELNTTTTSIPPNTNQPKRILAHLPANLVPINVIKTKHSKHKFLQSIKGLGNLDQVSLSRFYACTPAKMMMLKSVGLNERTCYQERRFRSSGNNPLTALVSFQGSGNTWIRHILEQATGVYTGSIYCDNVLKITYPGEYVISSNVLVVKTHHADTINLPRDIQQALGKKAYDRAIVLVRNPYDALLSEGNRRWTGMTHVDQHVGVANDNAFIGNPKWDWFVEYKGMSWVVLLHTWLSQQHSVKTLVVQYEKLQTNFTHEVRRMLGFLEVPVTEERLQCVYQNKEGLFKRRVHLNFDPFTPENKQSVNRIIDQAAPLLSKYNIHYEKR